MKRKISLLMAMASIVLLFMGSNVFANIYDNDIPFSFYVKPYYQNSTDPTDRERTTTNVNNAWKVFLDYSNEPGSANTKTTFWLSTTRDGTGRVSGAFDILENQGTSYMPAYASASGEWVYLAAENNSYTGSTYYVIGIWDEETTCSPNRFE